MVRRITARRDPRRELVRKRENSLYRSTAAMLPALLFETPFKGRNHNRRQAFSRKLGDFRSKRIGSRILEVQTLQNSTSIGQNSRNRPEFAGIEPVQRICTIWLDLFAQELAPQSRQWISPQSWKYSATQPKKANGLFAPIPSSNFRPPGSLIPPPRF